jgi:hypothetical protein|tara:strand:- start:146 stop:292 length:147 start_codon:yes stop_codon:yes gene_type:complete
MARRNIGFNSSYFRKPKKKRRGIHSKNLSRGKHPANHQYKKPYNRQGR